MTVNRTLFTMYRTIKRNRFRKKKNIYKQVYRMSFDKTVLLYALALLGYIITAVFISGNFTNPLQNGFAFLEEIGTRNFLVVVSIYPLRYMFQAFRQPGIILSSSEYQLSILPFGLREVWNVIVIEKWVKRIGGGLILWLMFVVTPLPNTLTGAYILTLLLIDIGMTAPLWRIYQQRLLSKLASFLGALLLIGLLIYIEPILASVVVFISIILWNVFAWKHLLKQVDWGRVVEGSDHKVWKMPLISSITKVPFKREKRIYVLQKLKFRRKKFDYHAASIHHRLWHSYVLRNVRVLFQMFGILLGFMTAMIFVNPFIFYLSIAISVYIFTKMSASLFYDRFKTDILEVLPWDISSFRKSFLRWNLYGGVLLIVPIIAYDIFHLTWWVPLEVALIISVAIYALNNELERASVLLAKSKREFFISDAFVVIGLFAIVFTGTYPFVSLLTIVFGFLCVQQRRRL